MKQVIIVEVKKLVLSRVGMITTVLLSGGIVLISTMFMLGIKSGSPEILAKTDPQAAFDWATLMNIVIEISATAALLGFGIVIAWQFAREFYDKTIYGMFSLPISRSKIAGAKIIAFALWCLGMSVLLPAVIAIVGVFIGLGDPFTQSVIGSLVRLHLLLLMTAVIAIPVSIVATYSRSLLGGVGAAICLVALSPVMVIAGVKGWFIPSAPALWAMDSGQLVSDLQILLVVPYGVIFVFLLVASWKYMQLD